MIDLARVRPALLAVPYDLAAESEIVELRKPAGKTFVDINGGFRVSTAMGVIHYRDDYGDPFEQWKEIDLSIDANGQVSTAPYSIEIFTDRIGYTYTSKRGGQIDVTRFFGMMSLQASI
jgi:hypothetical protein